jgi:hypothetical protein
MNELKNGSLWRKTMKYSLKNRLAIGAATVLLAFTGQAALILSYSSFDSAANVQDAGTLSPTLYAAANVSISTTTKKVGAGSLYLNGDNLSRVVYGGSGFNPADLSANPQFTIAF